MWTPLGHQQHTLRCPVFRCPRSSRPRIKRKPQTIDTHLPASLKPIEAHRVADVACVAPRPRMERLQSHVLNTAGRSVSLWDMLQGVFCVWDFLNLWPDQCPTRQPSLMTYSLIRMGLSNGFIYTRNLIQHKKLGKLGRFTEHGPNSMYLMDNFYRTCKKVNGLFHWYEFLTESDSAYEKTRLR